MREFKVYIINIFLFIVLFVIYYITGFLLGYGSNDSYESNSWWLYTGFTAIHLIINVLFIAKHKVTEVNHMAVSSVLILALYGILAYIFP